MGMFDEVVAYCPKCAEEVVFQSKVGACQLRRYPTDKVPPAIAEDLNWSIQDCPGCGYTVSLNLPDGGDFVRMIVN